MSSTSPWTTTGSVSRKARRLLGPSHHGLPSSREKCEYSIRRKREHTSRSSCQRGYELSDPPIRTIIADDHALFRQGLRLVLELESDVEVVAEVERAADLASTVRTVP